MKSVLLAAAASIAAVTLPSAPSQAQDFNSGFHDGGFVSGGLSPGTFNGAFPAEPRFQGWGVRSRPGFGFGFDHRRHDGDHRRHRRDGLGTVVFSDYYGGEWALYNNRSWEQDSYNDWWHENPERAYPAWMRHNQHCDRMWWSGDTLIC